MRRVVDGSSQTQDSFYDTPDSGSVSDDSFVQQYVQQPSLSAFGDSEVGLAGNRNGASDAGDGSDGNPGSNAELYQRLVRAGRVKWSAAQLNRLREEQRCFFCGEKGHQKSECAAVTPADPGNFRFLHNLEVVQLDDSESLDSDDEMRELLLDFDQSKNGASSRR